jgi:hypothetical protein
MVLKAIVETVKKAKPKKLEKVIKSSEQAESLLNESQKKINLINEGKLKALDPDKIAKPLDTANFLGVDAATVAPVLTPKVVKSVKVKPPKPSSKKAVDDFFTEEQKILDKADLDGDEGNFLNFNKINASNDILNSINALGKRYTKQINKQKRGIQTWKETNELAELLGENAETLAGSLLKLRPGSPLNAAEIKAAKNLLISQHKRLTELALKLGSETGDNTKVALEFAQQHALTVELQKIYKGAQTEIARALNILKEPVQEGASINLDLDRLNRQNILMNLGGKNHIKSIAEMYLETPTLSKKIKFAEKSILSKGSDALVEVFLNNILSGTLTFVKNIGGNWIYKAMEKLERRYATFRFGGKTLDSVAEYEHIAQSFGEHLATANMWRSFSQKWKSVNVLKNPFRNVPGFDATVQGTKFESPVDAFSAQGFGMDKNSIMGKVVDVSGTILTMDRIPYKFLQNTDNWFKTQAFQSEMYALAFRETVKRVKMGLPMDKASDYLAALITKPPQQFTELAYEAALRRTFQTPLSKRKDILGEVTTAIQDIKTSPGFNPLSIFSSQYFTFLRTPTNIAGTALERIPGANRILRQYRKALSDGGANAEMAKAKAAMGWAFMATFVPLGYFGVFHGSDPDVRGRKKYHLRKSDNRQPKSFRFTNILPDGVQELTGLSGSKLQLSLNGFEPAVLLASTAADLGALLRNFQDDWTGWKKSAPLFYELFTAYAVAFGDNVLNSTFMNGAGRLVDLISHTKMATNKTEVLGKEFKKIGAGLVPYTMFLQQFEDIGSKEIDSEKYGIVNADDFRKLNIDFLSMLQKFVPGFENDLYLDYDWLGAEVPKFSVISSMEINPVNTEAIKIGYEPTPIKRKINFNAYEMEYGPVNYGIEVNVPLTEKEYHILQRETGKKVNEYLTKLLKSERYNSTKDQTLKLTYFKDEVARAKLDVKKAFLNENGPFYKSIRERAEKLATKKWKNNQGNIAIGEQ